MAGRFLAVSIATLLAAVACASRIDAQLAAARTTADVTALVGAEPVCAPEERTCTWRGRVARRNDCTGYADCASAKRRAAAERVVTCRVDAGGRVSDCRAESVR
jgi:hypothetical protein